VLIKQAALEIDLGKPILQHIEDGPQLVTRIVAATLANLIPADYTSGACIGD
jgi:hypothetical protein